MYVKNLESNVRNGFSTPAPRDDAAKSFVFSTLPQRQATSAPFLEPSASNAAAKSKQRRQAWEHRHLA
jgi:hypothetical protein